MQWWLDSTTTVTPCGWSISERARATCLWAVPGLEVDYSSDLGEANYSAVGDVSDVHLALLACNRLGTGSLIIPSQRMTRGGARKAKRTQCLSRLPSHRGLRETRRRSRWRAGSLRSPLWRRAWPLHSAPGYQAGPLGWGPRPRIPGSSVQRRTAWPGVLSFPSRSPPSSGVFLDLGSVS